MDWRQLKKARTRRALQEHALRLFTEQGYEATTVEQIATAAEVSHMTFFRYFPTKEDVVAADDYDPMIEDLIASQTDGDPVARVHAALREGLARVYAADRDTLLQRTRLLARTPALRGRLWEYHQATQRLLERGLAAGGELTLEIRVIAAASLSAMVTALLAWAESDGSAELPDLIDEAFAVLAGLTGRG